MAKKKVNNPYKITPTELINSKGSFNQNFFYSKDGKWEAVSSEDNGKVLNTIDTFKNLELKKYYCLERYKWLKLYNEKKIWL